jgi:hypothetical protein
LSSLFFLYFVAFLCLPFEVLGFLVFRMLGGFNTHRVDPAFCSLFVTPFLEWTSPALLHNEMIGIRLVVIDAFLACRAFRTAM